MRSPALSLLLALAAAAPLTAQDSRWTWLGDLRRVTRIPGGIVARADSGALRIEQYAGIGFRVRYSAGGAFDTAVSYAVLPESLTALAPRIDETPDAVVLRGADLTLTLRRRPMRLVVTDSAGRELFAESFGAGHLGSRLAHVMARSVDAHYFGLGEQASSLDHTGQTWSLWNTDAYGYGPESGPLYSSFPFVLVLRGGRAYGLFYDSSFRSEFDFGARLKEHAGVFLDGGELRWYVFAGPRARDVLERYTRLTGRAPLPARWALGFQQSRWGYYPAGELLRVAEEFRSRGIPADVLYLDIDYMDGYRVFTWSPQRFPDPAGMLRDLAARGFKVVTIVDPGVKVDSAYAVYRDGLSRGVFATWPDGTPYVGQVWPGRTTFPDFANADARRWWSDLVGRFASSGLGGIWNDMNEPANFGGRTLPDLVAFRADGRGASHAEIHNVYALLEAQATYDGLVRARPDARPFVLTRAAFAGAQRYTAIWTGDNTANWEHPALAVEMALGLNLSGMPFAGADVGGFGGSPDAELYFRFLELGAFLPFFRTHSDFASARREPWAFGPVVEAAAREIIRLRYRLMPHLYTAFAQHARDGRPVVRPLFWDAEGDSAAWGVNDEFFFGDHVLVAPVVRPGIDRRQVYLPPGRWYRFGTDEVTEGPRTLAVSAARVNPQARDDSQFVRTLPLFVRAGAVVPMEEPLQYALERAVDTLELHVYDGGSDTSELYEDDGASFAYRQGARRLTRMVTRSTGEALELSLTRTGTFAAAASRFRIVIHGLAGPPRSGAVDGRPTGVTWDAFHHTATLEAPGEAGLVRLVR